MYFHYSQPMAHSVDLKPIFLGPYGLIVVGAQILPGVFNSIPKKWRSTALPLCFWWCRSPKGL